MDFIAGIIGSISGYLYGYILIALLIAAGLYFSFRTKFVQVRLLKESIKVIAEKLGLSIPNIDETRSRRSYNRYILEYQSVLSEPDDAVQTAVLMETSFAEVAFPTVVLPVQGVPDMKITVSFDKSFKIDSFEIDMLNTAILFFKDYTQNILIFKDMVWTYLLTWEFY